MPIMTKKLYKCPKCGYTKIVSSGDLLTPMDLNQICPKCHTTMELVSDISKSSIFDLVKIFFKK